MELATLQNVPETFTWISMIQATVMLLLISLHLSIKGSFKNYVDIIFWFFDHPTTSMVIFYVPKMEKNSKFLTRYPPSVVHMVFEWPLTLLRAFQRGTVMCIWEFTPGLPGSRFLLPFLSPLSYKGVTYIDEHIIPHRQISVPRFDP